MSEESDGDDIKYHETVIKTSIKTYVKHEKFYHEIQKRVDTFSKRQNLASIALCGILKECFQGHYDVRNATIPDIFDQTFIRQLLIGSHGANLPNSYVEEYYSRFPMFLRDIKRYTDDSNMYTRGAKSYITNIKNSLKMNFEDRLKTFTKRFQKTHGLKDKEGVVMYYQIMGWKIPPSLATIDISTNNVAQECIKEVRRILQLRENYSINKKSLDSSKFLLNVLRLWVYFNRFYEFHDFKKFSIIPISRIKHHFISIDPECMYGLFKDAFVDFDEKRKDFLASVENKWDKVFKLEKICKTAKVNKRFSNLIQTDGITMCCHFKEEIKSSDKTNDDEIRLRQNENTIVLGVDPGRVHIYTIVEILPNNQVKVYVLSRSRYYEDSGINVSNKNTKTWSKGIQDSLNMLSTVSIKGVNLQNHTKYLKIYFAVYDSLWKEYTKPRWARQRFRLYGGKKRVFAKFFNEIIKGREDKTFQFAYGSAKFSPGGKNEVAVPTTRAYKECSSRFLTKPVDEHLTTKISNETKQVLKGVCYKSALKNVNRKIRFIRGLYWCDSTIAFTKRGKFVNRDVNAALNILECGLALERPEALRRKDTKTEIKLGVAIRNNKLRIFY